MKELNIRIEKTTTGFSAFIKEIPVYTTGKNIESILKNIREALVLYYIKHKKS